MKGNQILVFNKTIREANKALKAVKNNQHPLAILHKNTLRLYISNFRTQRLFFTVYSILIPIYMFSAVFLSELLWQIIYLGLIAWVGYQLNFTFQRLGQIKKDLQIVTEVTDQILEQISYEQLKS